MSSKVWSKNLNLDSTFLDFRRTPCTDGVLEYDPKEIFKLYVGLNDLNINDALSRNPELHERNVDTVIMHPDWTGTGLTFPDLALIKSRSDFVFKATGKKLL